MEESQYGFSMGGGILLNFFGNKALKMDYAYRDIGILGNVSNYTISFMF